MFLKGLPSKELGNPSPPTMAFETSGFRLYSIGPNGKDDHGSQSRRGGGPFADIVVTYPFFESSVGKTE